MNAATMRIASRLGVGLALCGLLAGCGDRKREAALPERQFESAEAAAAALVAASEQFDVPELLAILGPAGEALVSSEDTVLDRNNAVAFAAEARVQQRLEYDAGRKSAVLSVGAGDWPMPIPIVQQRGKWYFDAEAGREEAFRRRIGRNELNAIEVCRDYVDAQWAYALEKHDGALVNQYAQRVISTPGKQDGLAWRAKDGTLEGPLGEMIAQFIAEGYRERYEPFHGYYFKVLKGQGPAAQLGEMDFMVKGAMIGGFAMVATPAEYLVTGVKTFIVSHDGIVYEKDLGEKSVELFRAMERYDPDSTWKPVQDD
jgi:hypothetical protein